MFSCRLMRRATDVWDHRFNARVRGVEALEPSSVTHGTKASRVKRRLQAAAAVARTGDRRIQDPGSRDHTNHEKHTMSAPPRRHNVSPKAQDHAASRQCGARCKWGKQTPASAVVTGSASPERTESRRVVSAWRQGAGVSLSATNTQQSRTGEHGYCMVKDGRPRQCQCRGIELLHGMRAHVNLCAFAGASVYGSLNEVSSMELKLE
ncbi:predicted protein [Postia placenta Mad-698-R]|nr:predicted protein [Postia placenta Mad-698-R]